MNFKRNINMSIFKMTPKRKTLLNKAINDLKKEVKKEGVSYSDLYTKIETITMLVEASNEKIEEFKPKKK